jgi:hypothetical protein
MGISVERFVPQEGGSKWWVPDKSSPYHNVLPGTSEKVDLLGSSMPIIASCRKDNASGKIKILGRKGFKAIVAGGAYDKFQPINMSPFKDKSGEGISIKLRKNQTLSIYPSDNRKVEIDFCVHDAEGLRKTSK